MKPIAPASIVWPYVACDPAASTALPVEELIEAGGAAGLRSYIAARLAVMAGAEPDAPRSLSAFAVDHLSERVSDVADGGVTVSAASLQMALAYIMYLEAAVSMGGPHA